MSLLSRGCRIFGMDSIRKSLILTTSASASQSTSTTSSSDPPKWTSSPVSHRPAGTEPWHERLAVPGSAGHVYNWPNNNLRVHRPLDEMPQDSEEFKLLNENKHPSEIRPAYICHMRAHIKYSPKKMQLIASLIRGMTVEEAKKQLDYVQLKGSLAVKEVLEEAQAMAVKDHGVEFRTNLWVAESFAVQSMIVKGIRRHARGRVGQVNCRILIANIAV